VNISGNKQSCAALLGLVLTLACAADPSARRESDAGWAPADGSAALPSALAEGWNRELTLATLSDRDPAPDVVEVELEARIDRVDLGGGRQVEAWTYNGLSPGPTIRAREGDKLRVHFVNRLPEPTTIHWHGLEVPAAQDGAGHVGSEIPPNGRFDYEFTVPHAGTYWYHPHINSAAQVWRGLYGALIVEGPREPDLGDELTLVLHDVNVVGAAFGAADASGDLGRFFGHEGFTLLVNGRELPTARVPPNSTLRLRVINAAISRYFRFAVAGHTLLRVAGDSGFSERAQRLDDVVLAPGERSELVLVLQGAPGQLVEVRSLAYDRFLCEGCSEASELMQFELVPGSGRAVAAPSELAAIAPIDVSRAVHRNIELGEVPRGDRPFLGINGQVHGLDGLELHAQVGSTEVWNLTNRTQYDHPFHLHGFRFQLLDVEGKRPAVREWKDTVNLRAKSGARIAVTYDDRPGMWMFHCHILDHADLGMMGVLHLMAAH
jgi:FtsP/CotA-like multicopper oxidase with cupredoxin domain